MNLTEASSRGTNSAARPVRQGPGALGVVRVGGMFRLLAMAGFGAGETLLTLDGEIVDRPSRYSVQVGAGEHVDLPATTALLDELDRYPWRFLNHSCDPNAMIRDRVLIALRPIRSFDEITFDYNTTEYAMAEPFDCQCGALCCVGVVRGFRDLPAPQRRAIAPRTARHVLDLAGMSAGGERESSDG